MIDLLRSGAALTLPLLPSLLRARGSGSGGSVAAGARTPLQQRPGAAAGVSEPDGSPCYSCSDEEVDAGMAAAAAAAAADGLLESPLVQAERISRQFGLNQEQAEVLQYVAGWASVGSGGGGSASKRRGSLGAATAEGQPPPICLVHGPFGSGEQCGLHGACMAPHFARSGAHRCCHWVGCSVLLNHELPVSVPCRQVHPAGGSATLLAGAAHARGVTPGGRPHAGQVRQLGYGCRRSSTDDVM